MSLAQERGDPKLMVDALNARGQLALATKDYPRAAEAAKRALELDPVNDKARKLFAMASGRGGALALGQTAPKPNQAPPSPQTEQTLAQAMEKAKTGDIAGAMALLNQAISQNPSHPLAYMQRGAIKLQMKDTPGAILDISEAIARGFKHPSAYLMRAQALLETRAYKSALGDAEEVLKLNSQEASAYFLKARARMGLKSPVSEILKDLKQAAEINPSQFGEEYERFKAEFAGKQEQGVAGPSPDASSQPQAQAPQASMGLPGKSRKSLLGMAVTGLGILVIGAGWLFKTRQILTPQPAGVTPTPSPAQASTLKGPEGRILSGRFNVLRKVGEGGMGVVYEAFDEILERRVAIKEIKTGSLGAASDSQTLLKEMKTVASLKHPGILTVHDAFEETGSVYGVFEFVEGETLCDLLYEKGRLPAEEALAILRPVCQALDYAHGQKVIHRDLKPSNIMLEPGNRIMVPCLLQMQLSACGLCP